MRLSTHFHWLRLLVLLAGLCFGGDAIAQQQTNNVSAPIVPFKLNIGLEAAQEPQDIDGAIKILFVITLLTLAPSIILLMTSFTRIVIVLSFVRSALSLQGTPANQILIGLSLFMTYFIMEPVWSRINAEALEPYRAKQISSQQALAAAASPIRNFMLSQTRPRDVELFASLNNQDGLTGAESACLKHIQFALRASPTLQAGPVAKQEISSPDELPMKVVIPAFIISELRTAFQMGFLLFVPFILIDLVVATVLMSMGMMMMPPATIALPLKLLLFVLVDGWELITRSLLQSFAT